jgi:beta-barrel assembly-enhancing protease
MRRAAKSSSAMVVLVALTGGCSAVQSGQRAAANVVFPVQQEQEVGKQMAAELEKELTFVRDPQVQGYISQLGARIVAAAGEDVPEGITFRFHVVEDDKTVNAFAIPGGDIYVYTGLLKLVDDESELMGVLGHEVAHVTRRHIAQQLTTQFGIQALAAIALGQNAGLLTQLATAAASQGALLKYSRDHERDADYIGLKYEADAGWDPHGMMRFFAKMEELGGSGSRMPTFLLTHPAPDERVENAEERIAELGNVPNETGRERYQQLLPRLGGGAAK